jgi:hypothetical protein
LDSVTEGLWAFRGFILPCLFILLVFQHFNLHLSQVSYLFCYHSEERKHAAITKSTIQKQTGYRYSRKHQVFPP